MNEINKIFYYINTLIVIAKIPQCLPKLSKTSSSKSTSKDSSQNKLKKTPKLPTWHPKRSVWLINKARIKAPVLSLVTPQNPCPQTTNGVVGGVIGVVWWRKFTKSPRTVIKPTPKSPTARSGTKRKRNSCAR